jgi:hypothetical protein
MKSLHVGKVGKDFTVEEGAAFARTIGLELCATLKTAVGDLDKVKKIVKLVGFVNWCVRTCAHPAHGEHGHMMRPPAPTAPCPCTPAAHISYRSKFTCADAPAPTDPLAVRMTLGSSQR